MSEKMREAIVAYMAAGVGNSTDYEKQADARRLAMEALAEQPDQEKYSTFANVEYSVETHTASKQPAQGKEWRHVIVDVMADISDHSSLAYEKLRALLQAAPPAPSVPDEMAKDAARYRWIERHAIKHWTGSIGQPETWRLTAWPFNLIRGPEFGTGVDAAILAAAPKEKP